MRTLRAGSRVLLVAILLFVFSPLAIAERRTTPSRNTEPTVTETTAEEQTQSGNPEFGVLIILGAVGFIIFVAWVFSRVGDGNSSQTDTVAD